jgi:hypothetical protein
VQQVSPQNQAVWIYSQPVQSTKHIPLTVRLTLTQVCPDIRGSRVPGKLNVTQILLVSTRVGIKYTVGIFLMETACDCDLS